MNCETKPDAPLLLVLGLLRFVYRTIKGFIFTSATCSDLIDYYSRLTLKNCIQTLCRNGYHTVGSGRLKLVPTALQHFFHPLLLLNL